MRRTGRVGAAEVFELLDMLPTGGALNASLAAARDPDAKPDESPDAVAYRRFRRWLDYTPEVAVISDIRDMLGSKPGPRPWDSDSGAGSSRQVVDVIPI